MNWTRLEFHNDEFVKNFNLKGVRLEFQHEEIRLEFQHEEIRLEFNSTLKVRLE